MCEAAVFVEFVDLINRVGGFGLIGIGESPAVAHQHEGLKVRRIETQELTRPGTQKSMCLRQRVPGLAICNANLLPDPTHGDQESIVWSTAKQLMRVLVVPVTLSPWSVSVVHKVIPRIHVVLSIGV